MTRILLKEWINRLATLSYYISSEDEKTLKWYHEEKCVLCKIAFETTIYLMQPNHTGIMIQLGIKNPSGLALFETQ